MTLLSKTDRTNQYLLTAILMCLAWLCIRPARVVSESVEAEGAKTLRAQRIVLIDDKGRDRIELAMADRGPMLRVLTGKGESVLELGSESQPVTKTKTADLAFLKFLDEQGKPNLLARTGFNQAGEREGGKFFISGRKGSVVLVVKPTSGEAGISLWTPEGKHGFKVESRRGHGVSFDIYDKSGEPRFNFFTNASGTKGSGRARIMDEEGKVVWEAP